MLRNIPILMPLAQCLLDNEGLKDATIIDHLKPYGIVDGTGKLQIPVLIERSKTLLIFFVTDYLIA